ncbi:MAG: HlyC/CorC family transporter [Chlamydiales bacterium]|nr:HlyC/CorC family transporter [Chlamydiales bacterium]
MTFFLILLLILFIFLSAFLSSSETALFSLSSMKVKIYAQTQQPRKKLVAKLLKSPRDLLVTILMLNIATNILIQNTVSTIFNQFPGWLLSVGLPLILVLVFGEVIPKSIAISNNAKIAYLVAPFILVAKHLFGPVRIVISKITGAVSHFFFFFLRKENPLSTSEIKEALRSSLEYGLLQEDEAKLVKGYLSLEEISIKEVMWPRQQMIYFELEKSLSDLVHLFADKECTRIPVCDMEEDKVLGILSADQFFAYRDRISITSDLVPILKRPFYVPESITAKQLLSQFHEKDEVQAIVVDEYGSISGLVTKEDLVEIVFGQIEDKRDEGQLYIKSSSNVIIAEGQLELVELEELFDYSFDNPSNMATIGGWLVEQLQDIPKNGTKYVTDDFLFYVLSASPNKINKVYIRKLKQKTRKST